MLVVIDYDAGNLYNVGHALRHLGVAYRMSGDRRLIEEARAIILPGVGSARAAMNSLQRQGLVEVLRRVEVPFLGICLGMQLLFEFSDEDDVPCLGLLPGRVHRFDRDRVKVPHMGWNLVRWAGGAALAPWLRDYPEEAYFYFVHSYFAPIDERFTVATCEYDVPFSAAVGRDNFFGVQFHPERSGEQGLLLLRRFAEWAGVSS
ncbi:MAG: imidazole glycerol phosphate synthase subunit HisH [Acidobacteriota bacterium]